MKFISILFFGMLLFVKNNSDDVLKQMYERYAGKWMKSFSFSQTTERYRNDSLINTSTWYENVVYPDKFRIDFGAKEKGNAAIFTKDSIYNFRDGKLAGAFNNDDDLTFLLGGMYFYPFDSVKSILKNRGYDLNKFYENDSAYVIGANNATETANQFWVDKQKLVVIKFIHYGKDGKEEGIFKDHKQFGDSWSEMTCDFYVDGKLIQREKYFDCKADADINPEIFDYKNFSKLQR